MTTIVSRRVRLAVASRTAAALLLAAIAGCAGAPIASPPDVPSATVASSGPSTAPTPPNPQPPAAVLSVDGGGGTPGELGTYAYLGSGSDAPWLPGAPTTIPPRGGRAAIVLQPPIVPGAWTLKEATPGDRDGVTARVIASGTGPILFTLPPGAGTVVLLVEFTENAGSATWFWAVAPG